MTPRIETEALQALAHYAVDDSNCGRCNRHRNYGCSCEDWELVNHFESMTATLVAEVQEGRLVIDHLGDLLAHQMAETERWRQVALDGLTRANGHKRDLAALRAAVFGSTDYAADLTNGNFVEMAQALHAAQRGALARAEAAEAELAAARAEIEQQRARLEDRIHDC